MATVIMKTYKEWKALDYQVCEGEKASAFRDGKALFSASQVKGVSWLNNDGNDYDDYPGSWYDPH